MCGQSQAEPGEAQQQPLPSRPAGRPGPVAEQPLQCGQLAQPRALQQEHLQVNSQTVQEQDSVEWRDFICYISQVTNKTRYLGTESLYIPDSFSPFPF